MGFGKTFKTVISVGISPKRFRRFRRKLGLTGKQVKKRFGFSRVGVSSAAGLSRSDSFYGPTGSIVGRY